MGLLQESVEMDDSGSYPAPTRQAAAEINGTKTDAMSTEFSDKIMITITQDGRLAQWVGFHDPMSSKF